MSTKQEEGSEVCPQCNGKKKFLLRDQIMTAKDRRIYLRCIGCKGKGWVEGKEKMERSGHKSIVVVPVLCALTAAVMWCPAAEIERTGKGAA